MTDECPEGPELSVIVPTVGRAGILEATVESLCRAANDCGFRVEIVVVDDSKDGNVAQTLAGSAISIITNTGTGPASARNAGVGASSAPFLLFVDDDVLVDAAALLRARDWLRQRPTSALNVNWRFPESLLAECQHSKFGRYVLVNRVDCFAGWVPEQPFSDEPFESDQLAGFFLAITRSVFEGVGGFDETFTYQGWEDVDLSQRLKRSGIDLVIDPTLFVFHNEADRLSLASRLERAYRGGTNRRRARDLGVTGPADSGSRNFQAFLWFARRTAASLYWFAESALPNNRSLDRVYRRLADVLLAVFIDAGYRVRPRPFVPRTRPS